MPIRKRAENTVTKLLNRLQEARKLLNEGDRDRYASSFENINNKTGNLEIDYPRVKRWEVSFMERFNALEHLIYKVFSAAKATAEKDKDRDKDRDIKVDDDLLLIEKIIQELNEALIPSWLLRQPYEQKSEPQTNFPTVKSLFGELETYVAEIHSKNGDRGVKDDLPVVVKKIEEIKKLLLPAALGKTSSATQEQRSQPVGETSTRKVPEKWLDLKVEEDIFSNSAMKQLRASYNNLGSLDSKLCFLFCSIFPENAVIKRTPLVYWWISEGLISEIPDSMTTEQVGVDIFKELLDAGLLSPFPEERHQPSEVVNACKIHPWTRFMLISLAKEADLFRFDSQGNISNDTANSQGLRRLCLVSGNSNLVDGAIKWENNLSTLFNVRANILSFRPDTLPKLKKLVVLQLGLWMNIPDYHVEVENEEFLDGLSRLKHLKYLSLRGISRITALPPSIVELFSLEILDLKACHNLETLDPCIASLEKLTHLDVSDCPLLESMPKGLEKLSSLQVLKGFVIGNSKNRCKLADLVELKKLRRLGVHVGTEAAVPTEGFTKLEEFELLRCLTVSWGLKVSRGSTVSSDPECPLDDLRFPSRLEKLDLRGIPQQHLPTGLKPGKLKRLHKLYIRGGKLNSLAHSDADTWNIKILRAKYLKDLKIEEERWLTEFPHLIYLEVKYDGTEEIISKENGESVKEIKYNHEFVLTKSEIEKRREDKRMEHGTTLANSKLKMKDVINA